MSVHPVAVAAVTLVSLLRPPHATGADIERLRSAPAVAPAPEGRPATALRVAWIDLADTGPSVFPIALGEAKSVLSRIGLQLAGRRALPGELARPDEVRVILVNTAVVERTQGAPVLGAAPVESSPLPHVWVHVPNVRVTLGLQPDLAPTQMSLPDLRAFGVALGRVMAHEIVHALTPGVPHGTGLMSARLTRRQLTEGRMPIAPELALAVRAALRGEPVAPSDAGFLASSAAGTDAGP